jgi:hypothetical protein
MKIIEELLKHVRNCKYFQKFHLRKIRKLLQRTITEGSLLSFWDNEYDEVWNECWIKTVSLSFFCLSAKSLIENGLIKTLFLFFRRQADLNSKPTLPPATYRNHNY